MTPRNFAGLAFLISALSIGGCVGSADRIHNAVIADDETAVRNLVKGGADVNGTVPNRPPYFANIWTAPLHVAAARGDDRMVKLLIELGANVNLREPGDKHWTPLHRAVSGQHLDVVRELITAGADPAVADDDGRTPADLAKNLTSDRIYRFLAPLEARAEAAADAAQAPAIAAAVSAPSKPTAFVALSPNFAAAERGDDLAVIVGIESYSGIDSKALYAENDAESFKTYVRALGVPERNIVLLTGSKAVRSALTKNLEGWLPRLAKPDSRVYFYFSGHGAPDAATGKAYLVPWDGDPNYLAATAYPVAQLYQELGALPARQVLVAIDSCFSGAGGRSVLASGARPLVSKIETGAPPAKVTVLAASASNEISGSLDAQRHGAFTYFLLEGLNAGQKTPSGLIGYLTPRVQDESHRVNRDQTPQLLGDGSWSLR